MDLLVSLLVIVVVFGLVVWLIQQLPLPAPYKNIANVILVLIALVWLLDGVHFGHVRFLR